MSYTPPPSGAVLVELSSATAYTPPSASSITVDLAVEDGGFAGSISFVSVTGGLTLVAYPPARAIIAHQIAATPLALTAYAPTHAITKTSVISVCGSLSLASLAPSYSAKNAVPASAIVITTLEPTYFKGMTQGIAEQGALSLAANSGIAQSKIHTSSVPAGAITLSGTVPVFKATNALPVASLTLAGLPLAGHKYRVWAAVEAKYHYPDVTLEEYGSLAFTAHSPSHKIRLYRGIDSFCGLMQRVVGSVIGSYTGRVTVGVDSSFDIHATLSHVLDCDYAIKNTDRVIETLTGAYRFPITQSIDSLYSTLTSVRVTSSFDSSYSLALAIQIRNAIDSLYSSLVSIRVLNNVVGQYSYYAPLLKAIEAGYSLTQPVSTELESTYTCELLAKARKAIDAIYSAPDAQIISITTAPYVEYQGRVLDIEEAEISIAEGDYSWTCNVVLTRTSDYSQIRLSQPFSVVVGSERYEFIIDSKELDRSNPANYGMKIMGVSPLAKLASPRMLSSSSTWDTITLASDIAEELLPGLDWQVIDWSIPAYRFAVQDTTSVEAVQTLVAAIGATLETNIDGTPYVRSLYPVSVSNYATATPVHTFVEATDILSVNESYVSSEMFNRLVITDIEQSISDSLEWIEDYSGATSGVMRAYLYPWRSAVTLTHTGTVSVVIDTPTTVMEQHEEMIEVFQGQAETSYPIHHVESVTYEAQNVGGIIFDVDSRSFTVGGPSFNSVIQLVYWSRSLDYRVAMPDGRPTQFLLESEPL